MSLISRNGLIDPKTSKSFSNAFPIIQTDNVDFVTLRGDLA